jgi:cyclopropane fatty-acyl-phospholipid synthase-like methyltransferase
MLRDYRKEGLAETARTIGDALGDDGLTGSTVLELGCGFGGLAWSLSARERLLP